MTPEQAVEQLNKLLAHAWMVRTFLKHAEELEFDEEMLEIPRTIFDSVRAVEPAYQRGDTAEYLRRLRGKLPKLRRVSDLLTDQYKRVSSHTNFQMAALSLATCVDALARVFEELDRGAQPR